MNKITLAFLTSLLMMSIHQPAYADDIIRTDTIDGKPVYYTADDFKEDSLLKDLYSPVIACKLDSAAFYEKATPVIRSVSNGTNINSNVPNQVTPPSYCEAGSEIEIQSGVSPTGARTYTVPINLYPGINGCQPELSLSYNSQGGKGPLGVGWSLSGISSICRSGKSLYYDNAVNGVALDNSDSFTLDGVRLIKLSNTEYQSETGNVKAIAHIVGGIIVQYFEVFYPDGRKGIYGYTNNTTNSISYPLTVITDLYGNAINYIYSFADNYYRIDKITYADVTVDFSYSDSRSDSTVAYIAGRKIFEANQLDKITCKYNGTKVAEYSLYFSRKNYNSLLTSIGYSGCYGMASPLKFYYGEGDKDFSYETEKTQLSEWYESDNPNMIRVIRGRFNYFGNTDGLITFPNKNPYFHVIRHSTAFRHTQNYFKNLYDDKQDEKIFLYSGLDNVNEVVSPMPNLTMGKGFIDIICADLTGNQEDCIVKVNNYVDNGKDKLIFTVYKSNGVTGVAKAYERAYTFNTAYKDPDDWWSVQPKHFFSGDFDGDGKSEILAVCANSPLGSNTNMPAKVYVFDLEGNSIKYNSTLLTFNEAFIDKDTTDPMDVTNNSDKVFITDYDGDGKADICHINSSGLHIYKFNKTNGVFSASLAGSFNKITRNTLLNREVMPGDMNGDGLVDVVVSPQQTKSDSKWTFWLSKGNCNFDAIEFSGPSVQKYTDYKLNSYAMLQDVNGDGMTDLIGYYKTSFSTYLVNMSKWKGYCNVTFENELSKLVPVDIRSHNRYTQMVSLYKGAVTMYSSTVFDREDCLMTGMANSLGNVEKTAYKFLYDKAYGSYTTSYINKYPYIVLKENIAVVCNAEQYMNGSAYDHQSYRYKNAILHKQGLGFRGFEQITCYNKKNQITQTTYDPYSFSLVKSQSNPAQDVTNTYYVNVAANKIATVNLTSRIVNDKLQGISTATSYTYDSYGYPLTESISYSDGATSTTSYTYQHSASTSSLYKLGTETDRVITTTRNGDTYKERYYTPVLNSLKLPVDEVKYKDGNKVHERHFIYDEYGNVVKQDDRPYSSSSFLSKTYEYDNSGRLTKETDQLGLSTEYSYNTYGQMASLVDKYGKTTTYSYDGLGRRTNIRYPDWVTETTKYAWTTEGTNGCYSVTESVTGKPTVKTIYDALNREVRKVTTRFDGTVSNTDKTYDMYGRLEKESYPFVGSSATSWNTYSYDSYDRMTKSVIQGVTTSYSYSGTSVTSTVDGTSVTKTKDAQGNLISVTDDTGTLTYNLKADGQPSSIVSPTGVTTTFTYDKWRRPTDTNDPSLGHTVKYYNSAGLLDIFTDAQGRAMSYGYDAYLRMTSKSVVYGQTTTYTYDQYNNVKEINTNNGTKTLFTYDSYGRMTSSTEYADADVWLKKDFTYSNGNVSSVKYTSQTGVLATENYTYQNGYLVEVKNGTKSIYKINAVDAYGNATNLQTGGLVFNNGYTAYGNIASIRTSTGGSSALSHLILGYDAAKHRLISRRDNVRNITESFEYDCLDRLTKYGTNTVDYDDNGNITAKSDAGTFTYGDTKPYAVNGLNAVANIPSEQQDITYTQFYRPNTITQGRYSAEFVYNGDYDRVKMAVTDNGNACLTRYYLGGCYEMDITPSGTKEKLYLNGDYYDATSVIIKEGSASTLYNIIRDNIGSITHIVDENNNVVQKLSYDAWGRLRNPATYTVYRADEEPILLLGRGYTGHEHLQMFGLINMNARLYDPVLGRFLSPDPYIQNSDMSQNFNRYSYCMNSPLMYVDKNGEFFFSLFLGPVGAVLDGMCWGAVIGAGVSAVSYTVSTLISGQSWNANNFWKSVGVGAVGGALGGGFGTIGSLSSLGTFGNSFGYNMLSGITNTVTTNAIFGNDIKFSDLLSITGSAAMGTVLPNFKGVKGGSFRNCISEIGHNIVRGALTGFTSGIIDACINQDLNKIWQNALGGAINGLSRTLVMDAIFGLPYKTDKSYGDEGLYRKGGLSTLLMGGGGLTLGRNMYVNPKRQEDANRYHENYHVQQQNNMGWANFYGRTAIEYIHYGLGKVYFTDGTLENDAQIYMRKYYPNAY